MKKEQLAVNQYKDLIIESVKKNPVTVIEAPTGSGKTTQIPQILFNAGLNGWDMIGVTQPRRIAAYGVSNRIAYEMNTELGRLVGYKMRFEDETSADTRIKIMTDGILLEELRSDPLLMKYSVIMVDEAHERSLNIDFILGLLKDIIKKREDLRIVISSATINTRLFSEYFGNAPIISITTKQYPIDIKYMPVKNGDHELVQKKIIEIVEDLENKRIPGDVLIFLPGENDIKDCCDNLNVLSANNGLSLAVLPLYARLAHDEQKRVFDEFPGKRKIVIATNIAETSITIDGIVHVIDPGVAKLNYYNPRTFTSFLESKPVSKASCDQRMGRAGRTAPGVVYRLYGQEDYNNRDEYTKEEIYRTDLSEAVLRMADLGIKDFTGFDFISPPNKGAVFSAVDTLQLIGALDSESKLTPVGKKMVDFPLEPRLSRILIEAVENFKEVSNNVLVVISFLSARSPFLYPHGEEIESRKAQKKLAVRGGDFFSWINLFFQYQKAGHKEHFCDDYYIDMRHMNEIINVHTQLLDMLKERNYTLGSKLYYDDIIRCICAGLKQYICRKDKKRYNSYLSPTEREIRIHPGSYLFGEMPEWIVGGEIVNTGRTYIRTAAVVPEKVLMSSFGDIYKSLTTGKPLLKKFKDLEEKKRVTQEAPDRISVLDKYFDILKDSSGPYVNVPYQIIIQLKNKKEKIIGRDYTDLRAKLVFKDIVILKDKFNSLIQYFDKINLDNGLNMRFPKNLNLLYPDDWNTIFRHIRSLMVPTITRKRSRYAGFLTIKTDEPDNYNYYLEKDFFTALETSVETLEKLFDSEIKAWDEKEKYTIESVHHRLLKLSEEMDI